MSHFDANVTFHLHIHSQAMPSFKGFFDTYDSAMKYSGNYLSEHFPSDELEDSCPYAVNDLLNNSASITRIDKRLCRQWQKLFRTGSKKRVAKFFRMIVKNEEEPCEQ